MNRRKKGDEEEAMASLIFHEQGVPLLVSPLLLREWKCGQVDMARLQKESRNSEILVQILEVKSAGAELLPWQKKRLLKSAEAISIITERPAFLLSSL